MPPLQKIYREEIYGDKKQEKVKMNCKDSIIGLL
jgi:hypothetical protein